MSSFKAAQDAFDEEINQITSQIAQLEQARIDLRRRRNEVAPVSRVPPELLLKIFSYCTTALSDKECRLIIDRRNTGFRQTTIEEARIRSAYDRLTYPDILRVCHVSHSWRTLVIGSQYLWAHIQVQGRTPPELLRFMQAQAGSHPLKLDYISPPAWGSQAGRQDSLNPGTFRVIQDLFRSSFNKIETLSLYAYRSLAFDFLGAASAYCPDAESLQTLVLVLAPPSPTDTYDINRYTNRTVIRGKTPKLHHIFISGLIVPWKSTLLSSSPCLTHVTLRNTEQVNPDTMVALLSFLQQSQGLESLQLALPGMPHTIQSDEAYLLSKSTSFGEISLPHLKELSITSDLPTTGPLSAILSKIRTPRDIPSLKLVVKRSPRPENTTAFELLFSRICETISHGRDTENMVTPTTVEIHSEWAGCSYPCANGAKGRMEVSAFTPHEADPTVQTSAFQLPWSYKNLKHLTVNVPSTAVPESFWPVLANVDGLEVIQMAAENPHPFLTALRSDYGKVPEPPSIAQGEITNFKFTWARRAFPALRTVRFISVSDGLRWYAKQAGDHAAFKVSEHVQTFFKDILDSLRRRHGGVLEELEFLTCTYGPKDTKALLKPLLAVAKSVRWDEALLKSNGALYFGDQLVPDEKPRWAPGSGSAITGRMKSMHIK